MIVKKTHYDGRLENSNGHESGLTDSSKPDAKWRTGSASVVDISGVVQTSKKKLPELRKMFGKNLASIRKEAGYSQTALSLDIGMTHNFINDLEQGVKGASFLTLTKLSVILRTPVRAFFEPGGKQSPAEKPPHSDPIGQMVNQLHETIETWNNSRTK
jgi:transcriptional regulator with XRE-family HTH domain